MKNNTYVPNRRHGATALLLSVLIKSQGQNHILGKSERAVASFLVIPGYILCSTPPPSFGLPTSGLKKPPPISLMLPLFWIFCHMWPKLIQLICQGIYVQGQLHWARGCSRTAKWRRACVCWWGAWRKRGEHFTRILGVFGAGRSLFFPSEK